MDALINDVKSGQITPLQIRSTELPSLLDRYQKITVLSLDCFDTLLWRKTASPHDVFYDLQQRPTFKGLDFSAHLRQQAEKKARSQKRIKHGTTEVTLKDIYSASFTKLNKDELNTLIAEELAEEIAACYAFPPVVELIRQAHAKKIKIILISDTYLEETHLRKLLTETLPADVLAMISKIIVSSENGYSKSQGLFKKVFTQMGESAQHFLHLGDNIIADVMTPHALGVNAVHLLHHETNVDDLLRMQALSATFIDTSIRHTRALYSPYRGVLAAAKLDLNIPESAIGYASIGPILYSFGRFICDEVEKLKSSTKKVKVLFLLRDAYLPSLVCKALAGSEIGELVSISRFSATAASFRSAEDITQYLFETASSLRFDDMSAQLLLPKQLSQSISQKANKAQNPTAEYIKLIRDPKIEAITLKESTAYRKRLIQHLKNKVNLERDDTLMFVDLGYTGTAQMKLEPIFREELNVEIMGRYLIALRTPNWQANRKGLIDPSWCDDRAMAMLVAYIALLEQMCTSNGKSVIDYDEQGNSLHAETSVGSEQHSKLDKIQAEVLRFVKDAQQFFANARTHISPTIMRDNALAELGRLLFLPTDTEINYLQSFQFDLNLGTKDLLNIFDREKGKEGLRKRGLFFMEKNLKTIRTNYPAELRSAGIELVLTLMAQMRVGFDVRVNDMSLMREKIHVIFIRDGHASQTTVEAIPTHDGYYSLIVPVGAGNFQIGIQFGLHYHWVQLESAELIVTKSLYSSFEADHTQDASANMAIEQMVEKGDGLYECESETGLLVYVPTTKLPENNYALRIIFRPIVMRKKKAAIA